jgi:hypothetical protein
MWQGALRDPDDPVRAVLVEAIDEREPISIELLYTDMVGRQRTVTRFGLMPTSDPATNDSWYSNMSRHWHLDSGGPRPQAETAQARRTIFGHLDEAGRSGAEDDPIR